MNNDTLIIPSEPADSLDGAIVLFRASATNLRAAADMLARLNKTTPNLAQQWRDRGLDADTLARLLKIGERTLAPELAFAIARPMKALSKLPYSTQVALLAKGAVEVVVDAATGDAIMVPLAELNGWQIKQALGPAGVRNRAEQQAHIRRSAPAPRPKGEGPDYVLKRDRIAINRPCEITRLQLIDLLKELKND